MKRIILAVFFCLLIIISLCSGTEWTFDGSFDYSIVSSNYADDIPGVQKDGFVNNGQYSADNGVKAVNLAKKELNDDFIYNEITVRHDESCGMWMILFSTRNMAGGCITVYLDANGRTQFVVSGE